MSQHVAHRHSDEINQLRAEIERLRAERKMGGGVTGRDKDMLIAGFQADATKTKAEIERLRAENAKLAEDNISLEARLRCTEGWGKSLNAALTVNERLVKIEIAWQQSHEAVLRRNRFLESECERLTAALQYARNLIGPDEIIDAALASASPNQSTPES